MTPEKPIPENTLEAVARAICVACDENPNHKGDCRGNDFRWQDYRAPALAAINALDEKVTAPAVQGGPVATIHVDGSFCHVSWHIPAPSRCSMDVYATPQSAEVEALRVERDGANERAGLLLNVKNYWADRARAAETEREQLHSEIKTLLDALRQIAEWPDGGNQYGQQRIKEFATKTLAAHYKGGEA